MAWISFKKIVADLRNEQQRERETKAFIPRMKNGIIYLLVLN